MTLRLKDGWIWPDTMGAWLTGEPAFANSAAYERLYRSLRRYTQEEVSGRSILIAGHRGAGKTSTVVQAVRRLRNEILLDSRAPVTTFAGRRGTLQRPLLVKLVGQSLIAPPPPLAESTKGAATAGTTEAAKTAGAAGAAVANGANGSPEAKAKADSEGEAGNALVHITIALYRELAAEMARGFARHAKEDSPVRDPLELAAQLVLELDSNPDPATLRSYWARLGRLEYGVLWPRESQGTLRNLALTDQGMREIVAIATAAQAFQVCTGQVSYALTNKDVASDDRELAAKIDLKEVVRQLGSVAAGIAAGGAVVVQEGSSLAGIGAGFLVMLLSGVTLNWTRSRKRSASRTVDYSFLRDRTIQTLDRDLPLVIERIRHAGLAPVFVIDELDKLDDPAATIPKLLGRLKHLVSDLSFFCFLSDREYFEQVETKVAREPYPTEHTNFSERFLVLNRPADLFRYLTSLIEQIADLPTADATAKAAAAPTGGQSGRLAIATLALAVMYRSKLNFTDLSRELNALLDEDGFFVPSEESLTRPRDLRLAATIQLAINHAIVSSVGAERFAKDPAFAQLVIDGLYYLPRCWEADATRECPISEADLKEQLIGRLSSRQPKWSGVAGSADGVEQAGLKIRDEDLAVIMSMVLECVRKLASFAELKEALQMSAAEQLPGASSHGDVWPLADIVPTEKIGLIAAIIGPPPPPPPDPQLPGAAQSAVEPEGCFRYKFRLDRYANDLLSRQDDKPLDAARRDRIGKVLPDLHTLTRLLDAASLNMDELNACHILPATAGQTLLAASVRTLDRAGAQNILSPAVDDALDDGETVLRAVRESEGRLADTFELLARIRRDAGAVVTLPAGALHRIVRYYAPLPLPPLPFLSEAPRQPGVDLAALASDYADGTLAAKHPARSIGPIEIEARWAAWRSNLAHYFRGPTAAPEVTYDDLLLAARDRAPGNLFRLNLGAMSIADWSRLVLAGLPSATAAPLAPPWALAAGLRGLGFGEEPLHRLFFDSPPGWLAADRSPAGMDAVIDIVQAAPAALPGILYVYRDDEPPPDFLPSPTRGPVLAVGESQREVYIEAIDGLSRLGAFRGVADELHE